MVVRDPEVHGGERAIILDFGIAKLAEEHKHPETVDQHTDARVTVGTATYMAPEQAALERNITDRTDVYALGVVLYELLSGGPPFAAGNYALLLDMHRFSAPVPLERSVPGLAPRLTELVHRMLAKEPQARPGMAQVAAELEEVLRTSDGELAGGRPAAAGAEPTPPLGRTAPVSAPPAMTTDPTGDRETNPAAALQETTRRDAPGGLAAEPTAPLPGARDAGPEGGATTRRRLVPADGARLSLSDRGVRALVAGLAIAVVLALLLGIWLGRIS